METTKKLAVQTFEFLKGHERFGNREHIEYFLGMCEVCNHNSKLAMELMFSPMVTVTNRKTAKTWEDVWEDEMNFADQINSTCWKEDFHYEQAEKAIQSLEEAKEKEGMKEYLVNERGFYLFPELGIAFRIDSETVEEHALKAPGEHYLD